MKLCRNTKKTCTKLCKTRLCKTKLCKISDVSTCRTGKVLLLLLFLTMNFTYFTKANNSGIFLKKSPIRF